MSYTVGTGMYGEFSLYSRGGVLIATCKPANQADVYEPGAFTKACLRDINQHPPGACVAGKEISLKCVCQT